MTKTLTMESNVRVLLVDDEETPRDSMEMLLSSIGWQVSACSSGDEALQLLKRHPDAFDVVLTDIQMPEMNGHELIDRLRNDFESCPAIVAYSGTTTSVKHVDAFVTKPARASDICEAVENAIASHRRPR